MLSRAADDAGAADEKAASSIRRPRGLGGRQQGRRAPRAAHSLCQEWWDGAARSEDTLRTRLCWAISVICAELLLSAAGILV